MQKGQLTGEALKKHFKNNFELALYAINVAHYFIKSGHEVNVSDLLRDIQKNPQAYRPEELEALERAEREEANREIDSPQA